MAYTTVTAAAVGARIKAVWANLLVGAIQELQAAAVGLGTDKRPQLRVYAPASVTNGAVVPYATVRKDTHGGWSGASFYRYTVPLSGLWLVQIGYKCGGTANTPSQYFDVGGTMQAGGPNSPSGGYLGGGLNFTADLVAGDLCSVRERGGANYTPQNDSAGSRGVGSNFFCMTYLGPTT